MQQVNAFTVPYDAQAVRKTIFAALLDTVAREGRAKLIVDDHTALPLSYDKLLLGAGVLGGVFTRKTAKGETVGVLMPNVIGFAALFMALQATGRVVAMLNFSAGQANILSAARTAQLKMVVTARAFVEQAKLDDVVAALAADGLEIIYLDDLRKTLTLKDKLIGLGRKLLGGWLHRRLEITPDAPSVILFTSGSEGTPKGVVLSHANLLANVAQIRAHILLSPEDILVNPLPVFHCFGLTVGLIMPVLSGIRTVLYPSPLHYKQVPQLIGKVKATLMIGTDTFNMGYARAADPEDLRSLRLVVSGAERVREETLRHWEKLTDAVLLEGYGATECSPVISANRIEDNRHGTVGTLMAAQEYRLEAVDGLSDGGRLFIKGPNVMLGYLYADKPGVIHPPDGGWHDTGDVVSLDADGFITIRGRAKRFAKLGGEMVSLAAVENHVAHLWPAATHVVVNLPDPKKGEQLVLVTNQPDADRAALIAFGRRTGISELMIPKAILVVENVPVLGSGKVDYAATQRLAQDLRALL